MPNLQEPWEDKAYENLETIRLKYQKDSYPNGIVLMLKMIF